MTNTPHSVKVFAPAKINLYLHVTGRRANGYHELDSLIAFADIGDEILIENASHTSFKIEGPMAGAFKGAELDAGPDSGNLVMRAVWGLARMLEQPPMCKITLTKNMPMGAGLGGGSADAAAVIWGLLEFWKRDADALDRDKLDEFLLSLGADVPVCFSCQTARILGIGEIIKRSPAIPEIPVVVVYPGKPCATKGVFTRFEGRHERVRTLPAKFETATALMEFLKTADNALQTAAQISVPEIQNVLNALNAQPGVLLSRMSGSGSACFGLFENENRAHQALQEILNANPGWWGQAGWLGRVERY